MTTKEMEALSKKMDEQFDLIEKTLESLIEEIGSILASDDTEEPD